MRQHARSSVVIRAAGAIQAIIGLRDDASSKTNTPSWRSAFIRVPSIPERRDPIPIGGCHRDIDERKRFPKKEGPSVKKTSVTDGFFWHCKARSGPSSNPYQPHALPGRLHSRSPLPASLCIRPATHCHFTSSDHSTPDRISNHSVPASASGIFPASRRPSVHRSAGTAAQG